MYCSALAEIFNVCCLWNEIIWAAKGLMLYPTRPQVAVVIFASAAWVIRYGVPDQATLAHAVQVLMAEDNAAVAGLQPAVGRLANALVAVLGPELTLGSAAYCRCRAIIREMQVGWLPKK